MKVNNHVYIDVQPFLDQNHCSGRTYGFGDPTDEYPEKIFLRIRQENEIKNN